MQMFVNMIPQMCVHGLGYEAFLYSNKKNSFNKKGAAS